MLVKVDKLIGPALDWAVAKCINPLYGMVGIHQDNRDRWHVTLHAERGCFAPSTNWAQGGPLIDLGNIDTFKQNNGFAGAIEMATRANPHPRPYFGPTTLIAICRCYVASQLGNEIEIEIPNELFKDN